MFEKLKEQQKQAINDLDIKQLRKINEEIYKIREQERKKKAEQKAKYLENKLDCTASAFCSLMDN